MITAPYNFVPLNDRVFFPPWAEDVSHDIPFSDGESGVIDIEITAKSPIFIRDHSSDKENPSQEFCHHKMQDGSKQYYIPGSSLKGMTRSVMEILSFAKMEFINDATLSVRDMSDRKHLVGQANGCGFLVKKDKEYYIQDCGKPITISYNEVKNATGKWLKGIESAKEKYNKIGNVLKELPIKKIQKSMNVRGRKIPKTIAIFDQTSKQKGILVCTGSINNKKNEFIFMPNGRTLSLNKDIVKKFETVYFNEESIDGQFWQNKQKNGYKIPIFYKKDGNNIQAIGLTQLFKLAYNKTIHQAIKQDKKDNLDLPETILGTVKNKFALKGRVYFSHLASTHVTFENKTKEEILGTPNASYYPNYIEQNDTYNNKINQYATLMDEDAVIRGYKRYPLHKSLKESQKTNENEKVRTKFKSLDSGSKFIGKIRFHNLKKAEIGALLSALTFHGNSDKYMHNLGMAKPLGYGKIEIKLTLKNLNHSQDEYLDEFEKLMCNNIPNWKNSQQLKELFAMADINTNNDDKLIYQQLKNQYDKNEFVEAKKRKEFLLPYSRYGKNREKNAHQIHNKK
jgi:CRISPR-associated protein (TIGR03986 family)